MMALVEQGCSCGFVSTTGPMTDTHEIIFDANCPFHGPNIHNYVEGKHLSYARLTREWEEQDNTPHRLCNYVWQRLLGDAAPQTPELRAELDKRLEKFLATIQDDVLREHYKQYFQVRRALVYAREGWAKP